MGANGNMAASAAWLRKLLTSPKSLGFILAGVGAVWLLAANAETVRPLNRNSYLRHNWITGEDFVCTYDKCRPVVVQRAVPPAPREPIVAADYSSPDPLADTPMLDATAGADGSVTPSIDGDAPTDLETQGAVPDYSAVQR